jgi:carbamoyl-phosphate synthase small subunit
MLDRHNGMLVLEDGSVFVGESVGAEGGFSGALAAGERATGIVADCRITVGEVVFNTSMTGYQEIVTDPSYWGQMVVFTCPHIGNVGVNEQDAESRQPWVRAIIARQICAVPSNWRAQRSLPAYLREAGIPALSGVDTRRLTLILREKGVMRGALSTVELSAERLLEAARSAPDMSTLAAVAPVSPAAPEPWATPVPPTWYPQVASPAPAETGQADPEAAPHIVVLDCGVKQNIVRHLVSLGARVTLLPWDTGAEEIMARNPDGVLISNGPGDPECAPETVQTAQQLMACEMPILGICLGHQIIGLACGARKYKLPFGHHAGNHPVQNLLSGAIEITAQNHNYAIDAASVEGLPLQITHLNLNDRTVEGFRHTRLPVVSVQYHPEASPGPHDSLQILRDFVALLIERHRMAGGPHAQAK